MKKADIAYQCKILYGVLTKSSKNYIVILPNNDTFSTIIFKFIKKLKKYKNIKILPSLRFEYYLTLLKNSNFIIGNSSSSIYDSGCTRIIGKRFLRTLNWYDNEWGYSNRVVDLVNLLGNHI